MSLGLELQDSDEVSRIDQGLALCPSIVAERPVAGSFGKDVNSDLHCGIDMEFNHTLG